MEAIQILRDSTQRTIGKKRIEIPHPSELLDILAKIGNFSHVKVGGTTNGKEDNDEISIVNNYIVEVKLDDSDFFGTCGILVKQGCNRIQVYSGLTASACLNLSIFNADYIKESKIQLDVVEALVDKACNNLLRQKPMIEEKVDKMKNNFFTSEEWLREKGRLLTVLPDSCLPNVVNLEHLLRNEESLYAAWDNTSWKLLSCLTDSIKNESVTNRIRKTLQIEAAFF